MGADWEDLRYLLAVCDAGSASSAARKLGVDKATVVRRVARLERGLATRLLVRRASGWSPTPAGRRVAGAARKMSALVGDLGAELTGHGQQPRSTVSITAPHWFCSELLLPALPKLLAESPWLDVSVAATSRVLNLTQREADVAVRNGKPQQGDFVVRKAGDLGSALYASKKYVRAHAKPPTRSDLRGHALVGYPDRMSYVPAFAWLEELAAGARATTRTDDANAIRAALRAGLGVGVIPCVLGDRDAELQRFPDEVARETIWLVSPAELATTRAVKLVSAFAAQLFRTESRALAG